MEFITDEQREHPYGNVLLIGPPKSGKTTDACSAPGLVGLLNCDQPNATELAHEKYGDRIKEIGIGKESIKAITSEIMRSCYPKEGKPIIDTWVCDPIGDLHRRLLKELGRGAVRPSRDAYGDAGAMVEDFCRFMCEAPCNFVMVSHHYPVKDEVTGAFQIAPWTGTSNPAVGQKVLGMVDVIGYTHLIKRSQEELETARKAGIELGRYRPVAQIVPTEGRPVGVRGRFNRLLSDDVLAAGIIDADLFEWFRIADKHIGDDPRTAELEEAEAKLEAQSSSTPRRGRKPKEATPDEQPV